MKTSEFVAKILQIIMLLLFAFGLTTLILIGLNVWLLQENEQLQQQVARVAPVASPTISKPQETAPANKPNFFKKPTLEELGNSPYDSLVRYGYALIHETYKYLGPDAPNPKLRYAGNRLACQNCHLEAGTKYYAIPYVGIPGLFPQYRGRENKVSTLEERINGCMERSLNGRPLPVDSREMRAMVTYMQWLSRGVPIGEKLKGNGLPDITLPARAADTLRGKAIYESKCASCHGKNGEGVRNQAGGYQYPPLWGPDSYNDGAGMHRLITAAKFIKANMPFGATADSPMLTDEEAYDVAAFINAYHNKRPRMASKEKDYPGSLNRKPVSAPYGPYADSFPPIQHKYGPFQPIIEFYGGKNVQ